MYERLKEFPGCPCISFLHPEYTIHLTPLLTSIAKVFHYRWLVVIRFCEDTAKEF